MRVRDGERVGDAAGRENRESGERGRGCLKIGGIKEIIVFGPFFC